MTQHATLYLQAPDQANIINSLELDLMELRTEIAFLRDKNHAMRTRFLSHVDI